MTIATAPGLPPARGAADWRRWGIVGLLWLFGCGVCGELLAATPDSPEVRAMLDRAVAFLNTYPKGSASASQLGGESLVGLAAYKYQRRFQPTVEGVPELTQHALSRAIGEANSAKLAAVENYSLGLTLIFLTEVHPEEHMDAIVAYWEELKSRQKPNGAWGYPSDQRGDTSQLQYPALAAWSVKACGLDVDKDIMRRLASYILRVQDPSGAWGYQGNDPGTFARVPQDQVSPSLTAAGLGSLYVVSDFLGMSKSKTFQPVATQRKLPPALRPVIKAEENSERKETAVGVDTNLIQQAMKEGNAWFEKNPNLKINRWQFYFFYGLERYRSFREKVEGKFEDEPAWYNDGVKLLKEWQGKSGGWGEPSAAASSVSAPEDTDPPVSTAFAMLFLLRSARESIEKVVARDGSLRGGQGLPSDLSEVRMQDNRLVAPAITGEVADMITMLESGEGDKIESLLDNPDSLSLAGLSGEGREYVERLRRVVRTGSFEARLVATRVLGRQGDLDNVPILIFALTDPDMRIAREAQAGLRLTSRKFEGMEMPAEPQKADVEALAGRWKTWYKSVRPEGALIE
jgi:hypothetical protein